MCTRAILLLFFILICCEAVTCPGPAQSQRVASCTTVLKTQTCSKFYEFAYKCDTGLVTTQPRICQDGVGAYCGASSTLCEPSCFNMKIGGPNGEICSDFTILEQCLLFYADHYGNKWCYWDPVTYSCMEAPGFNCVS